MKKKTQPKPDLFIISWLPFQAIVPKDKAEAKNLKGYRLVFKNMTAISATEVLNCLKKGAPKDGCYYLFPSN